MRSQDNDAYINISISKLRLEVLSFGHLQDRSEDHGRHSGTLANAFKESSYIEHGV